MTHATISFKAELSERLGAPDGATPPADSLSGSLRVILELLLNAAQHLAAPQRCCSRGAPGAPSRLHCERTGSNLENLSATEDAPCAALQLLCGRRERQTKCASVKCFSVKPHAGKGTPLYYSLLRVRLNRERALSCSALCLERAPSQNHLPESFRIALCTT